MKPAQAKPRGVTASLLANAEPDHPDATLLRAWRQWVAIERAYAADHPADELDNLLAHTERQRAAAQAAVEQIPAQTPAGAAVKLRFALVYLDEDGEIREAIMSGQPVDRTLASTSEIGHDYLLRAIEDLERMTGV